MKAAELADALGLPPRQIRYMIGEGIIPHANGTGRGADGFDDRHLEAGRRYLALKARGHSSFEAKRLMAAERERQGEHQGKPREDRLIRLYEKHPLVLTIDPAVDPASIDAQAVLADLAEALRTYLDPAKE